MLAALPPQPIGDTICLNCLKTFEEQQRQSSDDNPAISTPVSEQTALLVQDENDNDDKSVSSDDSEEETLMDTLVKILARCLQPPVVGALLGMFVASFPQLRGIFVDLIDRSDDAPLEWAFDALHTVGQAAVPINMMILGCNLSASYNNSSKSGDGLLSPQTTISIVIGKMLVMPLIGMASAKIFRDYLWDVPDEIAGSFYLVVLIVFLTPTANNVMVMVELSGSGSKEGIARVIAWQYAVAPILLSVTMTIAVGIADQWSQ